MVSKRRRGNQETFFFFLFPLWVSCVDNVVSNLMSCLLLQVGDVKVDLLTVVEV